LSDILSAFIIIAMAVMLWHGRPKQQASMDLSEDDFYCLVQNIYHEA
jgi:hypothetical protein